MSNPEDGLARQVQSMQISDERDKRKEHPKASRYVSLPSFFRKCKRSVVFGLASTGVGKNAIMSMLPQETQNLVTSLSSIVASVRGPEKGAMLKEELIRFLLSVGLQKNSNLIRFRDLAVADPPLRKAFDLLCKLFNFYNHNPHGRDLRPHFENVERYFKKVEELMDAVLRPHYSSESDANRLHKIMCHVATADFFEDTWANPDLDDQLFDLYNAMNTYTQFHYHFGDKD